MTGPAMATKRTILIPGSRWRRRLEGRIELIKEP
jgi:hypothetical protein